VDDELRSRIEVSEERIRATHERSIEHVRRAIETEEHVIRQQQMLAETVKKDREDHLARVREGEKFLAQLRSELEQLEAGVIAPDIT
jgi:hypothetical protein